MVTASELRQDAQRLRQLANAIGDSASLRDIADHMEQVASAFEAEGFVMGSDGRGELFAQIGAIADEYLLSGERWSADQVKGGRRGYNIFANAGKSGPSRVGWVEAERDAKRITLGMNLLAGMPNADLLYLIGMHGGPDEQGTGYFRRLLDALQEVVAQVGRVDQHAKTG